MPDVEFATQEWVIELNPVTSVVEVNSSPIEVIEVAGSQGLPGAPGASGSAGYQHIQQTLSNAWTIAHNLGRKPSITIIYNGMTADGTIIHNSDNVAVVIFAIAIDGVAYCI